MEKLSNENSLCMTRYTVRYFTETQFEENFTGYHADAGKAAWSCFQRNADAYVNFGRSH